MRFHKIEMVGKFLLQKVDTLPTFNVERDKSRLVYNLNDNLLYYGNGTEWLEVGSGESGDMPEGNTSTDSPDEGKVIYEGGKLYYGNGTEWLEVINENSDPLDHDNTAHSINYAEELRTITAGTGLSGGGDLTVDRTLNIVFGNSAGTVCEGDDPRIGSGSGMSTHDIAGTYHTSSTLIEFNSKISDATLIDTGDARLSDARTPTAHDHDDSYVKGDNYTEQITTPATTWSIAHNLDSNNLFIQCWDDTNKLIIPNEIIHQTTNTVDIDFDYQSVSGRVVIIKIT